MGVGISFLIGLKSATLFILFLFLRNFTALLAIPILYASIVSLIIAIASHPSINLPILLGKASDGRFPISSLIIFSPYLLFVRAFSAVRRFASGEAPYTEICPLIYVGGWPYSAETVPPGKPAIIDCTCELPRLIEGGQGYFCLPTWDTRAPDPAQIEAAVNWACRKRAAFSSNTPIFVHCAYGHGRSVVVMCALLVALGLAEDWKSAEKMIKEKRPYIRMNSLHRKSLEEWSNDRLSQPKRTGEYSASSSILSSSSGQF